MKKENILVIFGGKSAEHDISIITGLQTIKNIDDTKYNIFPIYITRDGEMTFGKKLLNLSTYTNFSKSKLKIATFKIGDDNLYLSSFTKFKKSFKVACAIICCHGLNGEDGTLQGVLELSKIPYTSSSVLSSSICMDKIIMKDILRANKILTPESFFIKKTDYYLDIEKNLKAIVKHLNLFENFCFVKPSNLGSSIGINKCKNVQELEDAIEIAFSYDERVIIEKSIENAVEVNCAVLGDADYQIASKIEYPKSWGSFLNFEEKYILRKEQQMGNKQLNEKMEKKIKEIAIKAYNIFDCSGVVRIDFLVDINNNKIYLNELNSIPGSLAYYLFKENGYDFKKLTSKIIEIGKRKFQNKQKNKYSYSSMALANFNNGSKSNKYANKWIIINKDII